MEAAIDRVMKTYGMIFTLTLEQEKIARENVARFLAKADSTDEHQLTIEGLRYLRSSNS
jgi:hypothetical protein